MVHQFLWVSQTQFWISVIQIVAVHLLTLRYPKKKRNKRNIDLLLTVNSNGIVPSQKGLKGKMSLILQKFRITLL